MEKLKAVAICMRAAELVGGERAEQHGDILALHQRIAAFWGAYLGHPVSPVDVTLMMALMKIARARSGMHNIDDYIDIAGYAGVAGQLAERD